MAFGSNSGIHQGIGLLAMAIGIWGYCHYTWWIPIVGFCIIGLLGLLWFATVGHALFYGPFLWIYDIIDLIKFVFGVKPNLPPDHKDRD